jgi:hypothetical protein
MLALAATAPAADVKYWVQPSADADLAQWALEAWQSASQGKLKVQRTQTREQAAIRLFWVSGRDGLYGEAVGGDVYVRLEPGQGLRRDSIVYLTCLHELGHALGLSHTANFADIMYNFQYGGNIDEYFGRYVRKLSIREDIRKHSGLSPDDEKRLAAGL